VFDAQTLNAVYRDVVNAMTSHFDIEVSVLQALSYCLYEMMDNVHIHSGKPLGTAMTQYDDQLKVLRILIADDGMGIRESLAENEKYKDITEPMPQRNITKHLLKQENWNRYGRIQIYRLRNGFWNPRHGTETS
jgi:anti-sigma regulatory factor (Ser/Thr protein kinase)